MPRKVTVALLAFVCVAIAGVGILIGMHELKNRSYARVVADVRALGQKRPAKVSRDQWQFMIGWTNNDIGNCLPFAGFWDTRQLADDFHRRCAGPVDVATIDWLWDEISRICPVRGQDYSDRFRPTTPEHLEQAAYEQFGIDVK